MSFGCTLMEDPVLASDGHTYNRQDIQNWFKDHNTSPQTNEPFEDKVLRPNIAIRKQVIRWREMHGIPIPSFASSRAGGGGGAAAIQISNTMCSFSNQPLQVFCINCDKAICVNCAIDPARCQSHDMRPLASIVSSVRDAHAAWLQLRDGRPQHLQAETERVSAAANAAIEYITREIREDEAELKLELQRACAGDLQDLLQEQAQLLANVEIAAASPLAAVAGSEACRYLQTAVSRGLRAPGEDEVGGRFVAAAAAAAAGAGCARLRRMPLGRIVVKGVAVAVAGRARGVGGVAADGVGFLRAFGRSGTRKGQFQHPFCIAFDHESNLVVSDHGNNRIQVFRYSDGQHLRTIGRQGAGDCQVSYPYGVAFDGAGHLVVVDHGNHRVQVLNYADGSHVRTIGSEGSGDGQFLHPSSVAIDADGNIVVHDGHSNGRIQFFRLGDGAHIRSICSRGSGPEQLAGYGGMAFDPQGNLVVADGGNNRIQVFRYSDGQHLRTIGQLGTCDCQFKKPYGVAFDGAGHLVVVEYSNHRVQVLNYADGSHVRTIGSKGSGDGQFETPLGGITIDGDGRIIVCDSHNHRIQVLQ